MIKIYVAGPYTKGDVALNVRKAMDVADQLIGMGFAPYVPHMCHFHHMIYPHHYETWMKLDFEWLLACHAMIRLPGDSHGADREVEYANKYSIPVFLGIEDFFARMPDEFLPVYSQAEGAL